MDEQLANLKEAEMALRTEFEKADAAFFAAMDARGEAYDRWQNILMEIEEQETR